MAYQGFGTGVAEDGAVSRVFVAAGLPLFVSTSFSKSFGLYGERIGALHIVCQDEQEARRVLSQVKICIRTNYSNPPTHGAAIVAGVLGDPAQRASWERELDQMRNRIKQMRARLVEGLRATGIEDMDFIAQQAGMFSYSGLSRDQMLALRREHGHLRHREGPDVCGSPQRGKPGDRGQGDSSGQAVNTVLPAEAGPSGRGDDEHQE